MKLWRTEKPWQTHLSNANKYFPLKRLSCLGGKKLKLVYRVITDAGYCCARQHTFTVCGYFAVSESWLAENLFRILVDALCLKIVIGNVFFQRCVCEDTLWEFERGAYSERLQLLIAALSRYGKRESKRKEIFPTLLSLSVSL